MWIIIERQYMKGYDYISRCLLSRGIKYVFGYQGGAVTPLIDAMTRAGLKYVQCRHEQASGFAADAYARLTGKCAVVVVTNGPGASNAVTAVANAYLDSVPVLFITGQVNTADLKQDGVRQNGFQEIDTVSMVKPITKYAARITDKAAVRQEFEKAFRLAENGRKGAVLLDLPMNILFEEITDAACTGAPQPEKEITDNDAVKILDFLNKAKRPVIVAGGGIRSANAQKELFKFAQKTGLPVVRTLMGYDLYTETDAGFSGNYGMPAANRLVYESDLILAIGTRFGKRQIGKKFSDYAPCAKVIRIDIDETELTHVVQPEFALRCDAKTFLKKMNGLQITQRITRPPVFKDSDKLPKPVDIVRKISLLAPEDCIVTTDVGQNQMWTAQGWQLKQKQRFLTSGGLGCMGFALPAAFGATFAGAKKKIFAFTGDGGLQMNLQELKTIADRGYPIKIIVFNNGSLGMIREAQMKYHGGRFIGTKQGYSVPDLEKTAEAFGIKYVRFNSRSLKEALESNAPALIEIPLKGNVTRAFTRFD